MTQANSPNLENEIDPINQDGCHSKCIDGISISCNQLLIHTAWQRVFQYMDGLLILFLCTIYLSQQIIPLYRKIVF